MQAIKPYQAEEENNMVDMVINPPMSLRLPSWSRAGSNASSI
jgi:hypothetical protein